jgi:hypothetical protein
MASFMRQRISPAPVNAKAQGAKDRLGRSKMGENSPKNANDHEQQARVHPAQPYHSVVVPAPELLSVNVAVIR